MKRERESEQKMRVNNGQIIIKYYMFLSFRSLMS